MNHIGKRIQSGLNHSNRKIKNYLKLDSSIKILIYFLIITYLVGSMFSLFNSMFNTTEIEIDYHNNIEFGQAGLFNKNERFYISKQILNNYGIIKSEELLNFNKIYGEGVAQITNKDLLKQNLKNYNKGNFIFTNTRLANLNKNLNNLYSLEGNGLDSYLFQNEKTNIFNKDIYLYKNLNIISNNDVIKENCVINNNGKYIKKKGGYCSDIGTINFLKQIFTQKKINFNYYDLLELGDKEDLILERLEKSIKEEEYNFSNINSSTGKNNINLIIEKKKDEFKNIISSLDKTINKKDSGEEMTTEYNKLKNFFKKNNFEIVFGKEKNIIKENNNKLAKIILFKNIFENMNNNEDYYDNLLHISDNKKFNEIISIIFVEEIKKELFNKYDLYFSLEKSNLAQDESGNCFIALQNNYFIDYGNNPIKCKEIKDLLGYMGTIKFSIFDYKIDLKEIKKLVKDSYTLKKEINLTLPALGMGMNKNGIFISGFKEKNGEIIPVIRIFTIKEKALKNIPETGGIEMFYYMNTVLILIGYITLYITIFILELLQIGILYIQSLKRKGYLNDKD